MRTDGRHGFSHFAPTPSNVYIYFPSAVSFVRLFPRIRRCVWCRIVASREQRCAPASRMLKTRNQWLSYTIEFSTRYHNILDKRSLQPQHISVRIDCFKTTHRLNSHSMFAALPSTRHPFNRCFREENRSCCTLLKGALGRWACAAIARDRNDCRWMRVSFGIRRQYGNWIRRALVQAAFLLGDYARCVRFERCILSVVIVVRLYAFAYIAAAFKFIYVQAYRAAVFIHIPQCTQFAFPSSILFPLTIFDFIAFIQKFRIASIVWLQILQMCGTYPGYTTPRDSWCKW